MTGHVFISYRHEPPDAGYVESLAKFLTEAGIAVWYDRNIISGDRWDDLIRERVETCAALVVVMSPNSEASPWVKREISQAEDNGRTILPLLLAGKRFFRLADLQYDDVSDGQMPPERFVRRLRELAPLANATAAPDDRQPRLTGHAGPVGGVAWSPDGRRIATASNDGSVRLWDGATCAPLQVMVGHANWVRSVCWSPDGGYLASCGDDNTVRIWDASTGGSQSVLSGYERAVYGVAWSPDRRQLATAAFGLARVWDTAGNGFVDLVGHAGIVWSIVWSPDGHRLATAGADQTVRIWQLGRPQPVATLTGHAGMVRSVVWSPDGSRLASAGDDGTIQFWDANTGAALGVLHAHGRTICALAWAPDGRRFASASDDRTVAVWDAYTMQRERVLSGHNDEVWSVNWAPESQRLASGSADHDVRLWV